jgi:hypothetical protein
VTYQASGARARRGWLALFLFSVMAGQGDEALLRADVPAIHVLATSKYPTFVPIRICISATDEGRGCPEQARTSPGMTSGDAM